jgi:uncharacterized protein (TIGR02996 family)
MLLLKSVILLPHAQQAIVADPSHQVKHLRESTALLDLVLANPADDTARLVLADLLRESDDLSEQARGRFLWAGVTASRFRKDDLIEDPMYYTAHREIDAIAKAGHPAKWLAALGIGSNPSAAGKWVWDCTHDRVTFRVGTTTCLFARGMLEGLTLNLDEWYFSSPLVLASEPLEKVTISDVPGLSFAIDQLPAQCRLTARLKVPPHRIVIMGGPIPISVAPSPILVETDGDWRVEELFPNRAALIAGVVSASASLASDLREVAGDRWPRPPRKRK